MCMCVCTHFLKTRQNKAQQDQEKRRAREREITGIDFFTFSGGEEAGWDLPGREKGKESGRKC